MTFDILLGEKAARDRLVRALISALAITESEINLQYSDKYDLAAPDGKLFCLVCETVGGDFPVLLTLSCDTGSDNDSVGVAWRISRSLGAPCLIASGHSDDDDTMLLVNGWDLPRLVIVRDEYDDTTGHLAYYVDDFL